MLALFAPPWGEEALTPLSKRVPLPNASSGQQAIQIVGGNAQQHQGVETWEHRHARAMAAGFLCSGAIPVSASVRKMRTLLIMVSVACSGSFLRSWLVEFMHVIIL
jgi:hypothetical protein